MINETVTPFDLYILQKGGVKWEHLHPNLRNDKTLAARWTEVTPESTSGWTIPTDAECILFWDQLFQEDRLNGSKPLHFVQTVYSASRNYGQEKDESSSSVDSASLGLRPIFGLPDVGDLLGIVWGLIPPFVRAQIKSWVNSKNSQPIAKAITSFVVNAISMLPVPVPPFLVNGIAGILVPQLVSLIYERIGSLPD